MLPMTNEPKDAAPSLSPDERVAPSLSPDELNELGQTVDQYMTSLIQRLHNARTEPGKPDGGSETKQPSPPAGAAARTNPMRRASDAVPPASGQTSAPSVGAVTEPLRPLRVAESASDLSALRQLANEHTRQVMQKTRREQDYRGGVAKLAVGGVAIVASFALLWIWKLEEPLALAAAATSIMVAVRWSWQFLMLTASTHR
jgi:hypothetical protein